MDSGWLKTFLEPLINDLKPTPSTRTAKPSHQYLTDTNLVRKFSSSLREDHCRSLELKSFAVDIAKESLIGVLYLPPVLHPEECFKELRRRWKTYEEALTSKSNLEKSGSMWTIDMLERYIKHEDIIFVQPESRFDLTGETLQKICERVDLAIKAVCGREATVENLSKLHSQPNSTEFDARMILDAILQPLCVYKGLTVRSEQTIKSDELPSNRYDYIVYCNGDQPIGVVEAKRQGCLKDDSVAQLLVQLLLLSFEGPHYFYFGVLSDAYRFVFTGVSGEKVWFFQANVNQLEITTVKSDHDVRSIVAKISWLIDLAIQSRKSHIEAFFAPAAGLKIHDSFLLNNQAANFDE